MVENGTVGFCSGFHCTENKKRRICCLILATIQDRSRSTLICIYCLCVYFTSFYIFMVSTMNLPFLKKGYQFSIAINFSRYMSLIQHYLVVVWENFGKVRSAVRIQVILPPFNSLSTLHRKSRVNNFCLLCVEVIVMPREDLCIS